LPALHGWTILQGYDCTDGPDRGVLLFSTLLGLQVQGGKDAEREARGCVAVDEIKLKVNGKHVFVWAAVDARELLAIYAYQRSSLNSYMFLRKVLKACTNRPLILVDKGPWYPDALNRLGLKWEHATFG